MPFLLWHAVWFYFIFAPFLSEPHCYSAKVYVMWSWKYPIKITNYCTIINNSYICSLERTTLLKWLFPSLNIFFDGFMYHMVLASVDWQGFTSTPKREGVCSYGQFDSLLVCSLGSTFFKISVWCVNSVWILCDDRYQWQLELIKFLLKLGQGYNKS